MLIYPYIINNYSFNLCTSWTSE